MKILVSGSTGLIGSELVKALVAEGQQVTRLVRLKPSSLSGEIVWDPPAGKIEAALLEGLDAAVNLSGESIATGRWTAAKKVRILDSRIGSTRLLAESLAALARRPRVLVCASAVGYYGDRGDEILKENSPAGSGFLAELCRAWEAATESARRAGIRVINLRTGIVLSAKGGALGRMLLPFRLGVGGKIGNGKQYMSWIAIEDVVGAILHAIKTESLDGSVNLVSPHPVTNSEFTKTLGRVLRRPTIFPLPAFAARLGFGEMADEMLLSSQRVHPGWLLETGYVFRFTDLETALRHLIL